MVSISSEATSALTATSGTPAGPTAEHVQPIHSTAAAIAIRVHNLSKMYRIYDRPQDRLKQMFWRGRRQYGREFWALRNVSFDVKQGETVGIIGRNGGGKSTLLQIIAGTLGPTEGDVEVHGRVAALLELGSGFNPEFTGRENVFMNGSILGFSREEMEQLFDEIAAFADIGDFIEQPVKLYSSGMMVRLAFAVQACIEPEILIVDEALSVGDIFFQQKCYRRIDDLRNNGTSILFVSHNMGDVRQFCQRAILLDHGEAAFQGSASDAVAQYMLAQQSGRVSSAEPTFVNTPAAASAESAFVWPTAPEAFFDIGAAPQISNGWARCTAVALCDSSGRACRAFHQGETAQVFYEFELLQDIEVPIGGINIENDKSVLVHGRNTLQYTYSMPVQAAAKGSRVRFRHDVALDLAAGEYTFEVGLASIDAHHYEYRSRYASDDLYASMLRLCHINPAGRFVLLPDPSSQPTQLLHFGIANLSGEHQFQLCG
jgi:lipopolysaccharide transport system ATP-binding protein